MADIKSETIALGALFQCCTQIQRIASTGYYDEKAVSCVLRALAVTDFASTFKWKSRALCDPGFMNSFKTY